MYTKHYQLEKKPFQLTVDPSFLYMSDKHKEALSVFESILLDNKGFIMLTGDVGIGKTTIVHAFTNRLDSNVIFANISNPDLKRNEFYNLLGAKFNFGNNFSGKDVFLIAFEAFLEKCYQDGKQVLLIIDEAQRLGRVLLEEFRLLSNIELQNAKLINIFFVGQDELTETLERHENRALRQRMSLIHHLEPLSASETGDYIHHRLRVAGTEKMIFTPKAIREIYAFSEGYPRVINIICDHALLRGFVHRKKTIDAPEIIECSKELRLKKKLDPESSHVPKAPVIKREYKTAWSKKFRQLFNYLPHIAAVYFLFNLAFFFYVPLKAGASLSDILPYWMGQMRGTGSTISEQTMETASPSQPPVPIQEEAERLVQGGGGTEGSENTNIDTETSESQSADSLKIQDTVLPNSWQSIPDSEKHYIVVFELDADNIAPEGRERLEKTASLMIENQEITLTIRGYTDNSGAAAYNTILSQNRADIAKKFLVSKGISPQRITSVGKGSEEPIADNNSADGRRKNRRVEVVLNIPNEF